MSSEIILLYQCNEQKISIESENRGAWKHKLNTLVRKMRIQSYKQSVLLFTQSIIGIESLY